MKVLIIEDEEVAAEVLMNLIRSCEPGIEVLHVLDSVEDSVEWFSDHEEPDLLFLDIHLSDGSSFEIFEHVKLTCPIIFTTAYDQYALKAFKTKSIDYLLKPVKKEDLKNALVKYHEIYDHQSQDKQKVDLSDLEILIRGSQRSYKSRFLVKSGNTIKSISVRDIAYLYYEDRATLLMTNDKKRYPIKYTLDEVEQLLDPEVFRRANRQYLVHIEAIDKIHAWFKGRIKLDLRPPQPSEIIVSADNTRAFKKWLGQ